MEGSAVALRVLTQALKPLSKALSPPSSPAGNVFDRGKRSIPSRSGNQGAVEKPNTVTLW